MPKHSCPHCKSEIDESALIKQQPSGVPWYKPVEFALQHYCPNCRIRLDFKRHRLFNVAMAFCLVVWLLLIDTRASPYLLTAISICILALRLLPVRVEVEAGNFLPPDKVDAFDFGPDGCLACDAEMNGANHCPKCGWSFLAKE